MHRSVLLASVLLAFVSLTSFSIAAEGSVLPRLDVGTTGTFINPSSGNYWKTKVDEVIDAKTMILSLAQTEFLVVGHPTKNLADGEVVELKGRWTVTGTKKHNGRTYKVVEPAPRK